MKKLKRNLLVIMALGIAVMMGCHPVQEDKNVITVSIIPQKYFVDVLTSGGFEVNVMVPAGASPATYEMTPKQMAELDRSDLYFSIGMLGFEQAWLPRIERNNPDLHIINTSAGIDLIDGGEHDHSEGEDHSDEGAHEDHHHHGIDPHIWMSPKQAVKIINNMANALIMHDSACKDLINQNRDSLLREINQLDVMFEQELAKLSNRKFIIFHPALTYLARDYGLEQISMELGGKEPSPAHLKTIVDRARAENIRLLFIQKEFDVENATQMAKELDGQLIQIDPLAADWLGQMKDILEKLLLLDAGQTE